MTTSAASRAESASITVSRETPGASVPTIATRQAPRANARAKASAMRAPRSSPACARRRTPGSQARISARASGGSKKTSRSYSPAPGRRRLEHVLGEGAVQVGRRLGADRRGEARLHRARPRVLHEDDEGAVGHLLLQVTARGSGRSRRATRGPAR